MDIEALPIPGFREPFNCFSHLIGAAVFAVLGWFLVRRGEGSRVRTFSLLVLWFSSVLLLSLSGVYHMLDVGTAREVLKRLDVAGVFVLIAGTVTPTHLLLFRGLAAWGPVVFVWLVVAVGVPLRMAYFDEFPDLLGDLMFLIMGWGGAIAAVYLWRKHGFAFIRPLVFGGLAYSLGVAVLGVRWPTLAPGFIGPHELWHVAVLVGLSFHWKFVYRIAGGVGPVSGERWAVSGGG